MKITIVDFSGGGDSVKAMYLDGKLHLSGDYYHDKIDEFIEGWIAGYSYDKPDFDSTSISWECLTEASAEKFNLLGCDDFPSKYPFKKYRIQ